MYSLYCERTISNGNTVIRLANAAPAPKATNNAGNAQHINVDDDAFIITSQFHSSTHRYYYVDTNY